MDINIEKAVRESLMLDLLHEYREQGDMLPEEKARKIAEILNMSIARVHETASFYDCADREEASPCIEDDPESLSAYIGRGGFASLKNLAGMTQEERMEALARSGLKGCGGAVFSVARKWKAALSQGEEIYLICNCEEGEPASMKDGYLIHNRYFQVLEGLIIAANILSARRTILYLADKYRKGKPVLMSALEAVKAPAMKEMCIPAGIVIPEIEIKIGGPAYLCGEESALLETLEGRRPIPRDKPPYPVEKGLWQAPTVINNLETIARLPIIYKDPDNCGTAGTKRYVSVSGAVKRPGVYEIDTGMRLMELLTKECGGTTDGGEVCFVQIGGYGGCVVSGKTAAGLTLSPEEMKKEGLAFGTGAIEVFTCREEILPYLRKGLSFFEKESCGRCTPCRQGTVQLKKTADDARTAGDMDTPLIRTLLTVMQQGCACPLGKTAAGMYLAYLELMKIME